jgi:transposase
VFWRGVTAALTLYAAARQSLRECFATLHRKVLAIVRDDDVCRRLMTIPGVSPALGLTPVLNQSGESNRIGRVSLCGNAMMRVLLYEAAQVLLIRVQKGGSVANSIFT